MAEQKGLINLAGFYQYDFSKVKINITKESYSNQAWVSISGRDVFIDFLVMPGNIEDGIPVMNGIRIFMPPAAAASLAAVLTRTLAEVQSKGGFESTEVVSEVEKK